MYTHHLHIANQMYKFTRSKKVRQKDRERVSEKARSLLFVCLLSLHIHVCPSFRGHPAWGELPENKWRVLACISEAFHREKATVGTVAIFYVVQLCCGAEC